MGLLGVLLCIISVSLNETEYYSVAVTIHPFHHTNHDRSITGAEKPHVEELKPIEHKITVKKENLSRPEKGYHSFTLTKSFTEESPQIDADMKLALEMLTEPVNILTKEGNIVKVNNSSMFGPYTGECNKVEGSDGFSFPPPLTTEEKVYDPIAKQAVPLVQINSTEDFTYYEPNESYLATAEYYPENACYAERQAQEEDPKDGIRNIRNNFIMSQPHFLNGDPRLVDDVDGLLPDKKKHGIRYTVDATTGETLMSRSTVQFNIQHNETLLPLFWIEENYTRARPFYVFHEVFYFGIVLIVLGVLGTLVRIDLMVWDLISI